MQLCKHRDFITGEYRRTNLMIFWSYNKEVILSNIETVSCNEYVFRKEENVNKTLLLSTEAIATLSHISTKGAKANKGTPNNPKIVMSVVRVTNPEKATNQVTKSKILALVLCANRMVLFVLSIPKSG